MQAPTGRRWSVTAEPLSHAADPATSDAGVDLELPPEPSALRQEIRRDVLDGQDWQQRFGDGLGVGELLWEGWGQPLEAAGVDRSTFESVVRAYRRELWFWVLGERTWAQAAAGLAGRLRRRAERH